MRNASSESRFVEIQDNVAASADADLTSSVPLPPARGADEAEPRNFLVFVCYQIAMRVGWIFKTETIIMPAFLDLVAGAGWVRGFLPLLNRFGQSVPPLLFAGRLKVMPRKKWALFFLTLGMGASFLALASIWAVNSARQGPMMTWIFLVIYGLFFCCTGMAHLSSGTLQGKLVQPHHRGRLMMISTTIGAALAMSCAWWLLGDWLAKSPPAFHYLFAFTGTLLTLSAFGALALAEPRDDFHEPAQTLSGHFIAASRVLRTDKNFRQLAAVGILFSPVILIFPHYQALARTRFGNGLEHLMLWVVVQNGGAALFSLMAGPLADRRGNRLVLRLLMFASALTPLLAVFLAGRREEGAAWYWLVFVMLGLTPIMFRILINYTLEISSREDHPRYLGTLSLCMAAPFCMAPIVGWLIDVTSFELVMLVGAAIIAMGGMLTFSLAEPRHHGK